MFGEGGQCVQAECLEPDTEEMLVNLDGLSTGIPFKSAWETHLAHQKRPTREFVLLELLTPDTLMLAPAVFFWFLSLEECEEERKEGD